MDLKYLFLSFGFLLAPFFCAFCLKFLVGLSKKGKGNRTLEASNDQHGEKSAKESKDNPTNEALVTGTEAESSTSQKKDESKIRSQKIVENESNFQIRAESESNSQEKAELDQSNADESESSFQIRTESESDSQEKAELDQINEDETEDEFFLCQDDPMAITPGRLPVDSNVHVIKRTAASTDNSLGTVDDDLTRPKVKRFFPSQEVTREQWDRYSDYYISEESKRKISEHYSTFIEYMKTKDIIAKLVGKNILQLWSDFYRKIKIKLELHQQIEANTTILEEVILKSTYREILIIKNCLSECNQHLLADLLPDLDAAEIERLDAKSLLQNLPDDEAESSKPHCQKEESDVKVVDMRKINKNITALTRKHSKLKHTLQDAVKEIEQNREELEKKIQARADVTDSELVALATKTSRNKALIEEVEDAVCCVSRHGSDLSDVIGQLKVDKTLLQELVDEKAQDIETLKLAYKDVLELLVKMKEDSENHQKKWNEAQSEYLEEKSRATADFDQLLCNYGNIQEKLHETNKELEAYSAGLPELRENLQEVMAFHDVQQRELEKQKQQWKAEIMKEVKGHFQQMEQKYNGHILALYSHIDSDRKWQDNLKKQIKETHHYFEEQLSRSMRLTY